MNGSIANGPPSAASLVHDLLWETVTSPRFPTLNTLGCGADQVLGHLLVAFEFGLPLDLRKVPQPVPLTVKLSW